MFRIAFTWLPPHRFFEFVHFYAGIGRAGTVGHYQKVCRRAKSSALLSTGEPAGSGELGIRLVHLPVVVIVIGVVGAGKTTLGPLLTQQFGDQLTRAGEI